MKTIVLLVVCALVVVKAEVDDDKLALLRRLVNEVKEKKEEKTKEEKVDFGTSLLQLLRKRCYNIGDVCNYNKDCCYPGTITCVNNKCTMNGSPYKYTNGNQQGNQQGNPQYGNPQYGNPQYGNPQYGNPQNGNPQYGNQQGNQYGFGCTVNGQMCNSNQMCCTGNCEAGACMPNNQG